MVDFSGFAGSSHDLLVDLLEVVLEDGVVLAHGEVADIDHELVHDVGGELAGRDLQPINEEGQLGLMFFEELDVGCPFLVVAFIAERGHLLLDLLQDSLDFFPVLVAVFGGDVCGLEAVEFLLDDVLPGLGKGRVTKIFFLAASERSLCSMLRIFLRSLLTSASRFFLGGL